MKKAELFMAYEFVCDECGQRSYASGSTIEDPEIMREAQEEHGMYGTLMTRPDQVTCQHCNTTFETESDG